MSEFVKHFFMVSTLVCIFGPNLAFAAPQLEVRPDQKKENPLIGIDRPEAEIQGLALDHPKDYDQDEVQSFQKKYRWIGFSGEIFQGYSANIDEPKTIPILALEYSHRYSIDMYWQANLAFTDTDGIFIRAFNKEIVRDTDWSRICIRYGIQHTTDPARQFGSLLSLNNLSGVLGIGFHNILADQENLRLNFDSYGGPKGVGFGLGLTWDEAF